MKKILASLLLLALLAGSLVSCSKPQPYTRSFYLMGTVITVTLYTDDPALASHELEHCHSLLEELDRLWSRHQAGGELSRINTSATGIADLDARTVALLQQAQAVSAATNGAFDITLAPLTDLWESCADEGRTPSQVELIAAMLRTGYGRLELTGSTLSKPLGMALDLGGIGKGAAISLLISHLEETDLSGGLISFGSNVAVFGEKPDKEPYRVALRDPKDQSATVGTVTLAAGEVLSVSGDYERFVTVNGKSYHHILDPTTGKPAASGLSSVSVIAKDGALADALSTACFVMGAEKALNFYRSGVYEFEAVMITSKGELITTDGLTDSFHAAHS